MNTQERIKARAAEQPVHLYRGAPPVRDWSKHKRTVQDWTLCGIQRRPTERGAAFPCVEEASAVTCCHCLSLMRPSVPPQLAGQPKDGSGSRRRDVQT